MTRGLVVFAFGLRNDEQEPGSCNRRLARISEHIAINYAGEVLTVAEWPVARQLKADHFEPAICVKRPKDGSYLSSTHVWQTAADYLAEQGVQEVILVANPYLQLRGVRHLTRGSGLTIVPQKIGYVGFDKQSHQWWSRSRLRYTYYVTRRAYDHWRHLVPHL
jgi:hypothetical protein